VVQASRLTEARRRDACTTIACDLEKNAMTEKIVVFGAGATGRGHVGLLCWQAGFEIVFVDKKPELVEMLRAGRYSVKLYGEQPQEISVSGYRVYHSDEREAIAGEIRDAALVLTAVFDQNLADVAIAVAAGLSECARAGRRTPLNCIACENMMDSSSALGRHVRALLSGGGLAWSAEYAGFPDCMISRVVPRPEPDPLVIVAEDYNEWTTRAEAFRGSKPARLTALELVENQTARLERKLFVHNGGHATCGYFAFHRGHKYIHEAVADPEVAQGVLGALDELGAVVERKWGFSRESIDAYKQDLCRRGAVPEMRDEILRVVRDPVRKLSPRERLVAPANLAVEYGLQFHWIAKAIVAALRYQHPQDSQSVALARQLAEKGRSQVLQEICGIAPGSPLASEIESAWQVWPK
jgi:mannitol-1-phosphate 5-dehydrogenase